MREIIFRGQVIRNDTMWVEGFYVHVPCGRFCCEEHLIQTIQEDGKMGSLFTCYESTIGQYTGLTDKNGKRIFEGDILEGRDFDAEDGYGVVEWNDGAWEVISEGNWCGTFHQNYWGYELEVIGNIHDNPELLKGE